MITPKVRPAQLIAVCQTSTAKDTYDAASWLVYKLRKNNIWGFRSYQLEWNSFIPLLEDASGTNFDILLKHHTKRMKREGLSILKTASHQSARMCCCIAGQKTSPLTESL